MPWLKLGSARNLSISPATRPPPPPPPIMAPPSVGCRAVKLRWRILTAHRRHARVNPRPSHFKRDSMPHNPHYPPVGPFHPERFPMGETAQSMHISSIAMLTLVHAPIILSIPRSPRSITPEGSVPRIQTPPKRYSRGTWIDFAACRPLTVAFPRKPSHKHGREIPCLAAMQ
jgi:hypothetical protein